MSVAGFIAAQRADYGVPHAVACRAMGVSQAWFYKWRNGDRSRRRPAGRVGRGDRLPVRPHKGRYGSPRIIADLREMGWRVSENTVAGVMAEQRLVARRRRRRRALTRPEQVGAEGAGPVGPRVRPAGAADVAGAAI